MLERDSRIPKNKGENGEPGMEHDRLKRVYHVCKGVQRYRKIPMMGEKMGRPLDPPLSKREKEILQARNRVRYSALPSKNLVCKIRHSMTAGHMDWHDGSKELHKMIYPEKVYRMSLTRRIPGIVNVSKW